MKKEKSPILVVSCIIFLSLFIILPPVLRKTVPKSVTENISNEQENKLLIVVCNKDVPEENYQLNSRTKYLNGVAKTNVVTITKKDADSNTPVAPNPASAVLEEINYLKSVPNIQLTESDKVLTFVINSNLINANESDQRLKKYLMDDYLLQQQNYESIGYKCNVMES